MRIVSDGTPHGTRIYADSGEDLTRKLPLRAINLRLTSGKASAELYIAEGTEIDVQVAREHARLYVDGVEAPAPEAPTLPAEDAIGIPAQGDGETPPARHGSRRGRGKASEDA